MTILGDNLGFSIHLPGFFRGCRRDPSPLIGSGPGAGSGGPGGGSGGPGRFETLISYQAFSY